MDKEVVIDDGGVRAGAQHDRRATLSRCSGACVAGGPAVDHASVGYAAAMHFDAMAAGAGGGAESTLAALDHTRVVDICFVCQDGAGPVSALGRGEKEIRLSSAAPYHEVLIADVEQSSIMEKNGGATVSSATRALIAHAAGATGDAVEIVVGRAKRERPRSSHEQAHAATAARSGSVVAIRGPRRTPALSACPAGNVAADDFHAGRAAVQQHEARAAPAAAAGASGVLRRGRAILARPAVQVGAGKAHRWRRHDVSDAADAAGSAVVGQGIRTRAATAPAAARRQSPLVAADAAGAAQPRRAGRSIGARPRRQGGIEAARAARAA
ncbi:hypothetical protein, partial [Bordetella bronchiseptica]|uniref:hypothetical protein n=1 Tax=Bordetella bronchiseptica TaxID=518 RepID=UPI00190FBEC8